MNLLLFLSLGTGVLMLMAATIYLLYDRHRSRRQ
jgi:hypothetical protein